jgi:hypothetical protein
MAQGLLSANYLSHKSLHNIQQLEVDDYSANSKWKWYIYIYIYIYIYTHNREASKVTVNSSYFHPAHQHYTDEAQKAETVPSVVIYIYIYMEKRSYCCKDLYYTINGLIYELIPAISNLAISNITVEHLYQLSISV